MHTYLRGLPLWIIFTHSFYFTAIFAGTSGSTPINAPIDLISYEKIQYYQPIRELCDGKIWALRSFTAIKSGLPTHSSLKFKWVTQDVDLSTKVIPIEQLHNCKDVRKIPWTKLLGRLPNLLSMPTNSTLVMANPKVPTSMLGSYLTADLCPAKHKLDRGFFTKWFDESKTKLLPQQGPLPIGLSISGMWLKHHKEDFTWLLQKQAEKKLTIQWINHSYSHPFLPEIPDDKNFLLLPHVDFSREVLENEKMLLRSGGLPSPFFRYPGLVDSNELNQRLNNEFGLIRLSANAWLAKGQKPRPKSILLIHLNGNEPLGLQAFDRLWLQKKIPLPFVDLSHIDLSQL